MADELQKESFESTMSDEELIDQIDAWEDESRSVYSVLLDIWRQNWEYYIGNQTGLWKIRGKQSRAIENRIFMAVETMIPIATSRLPDIEVRPGDEDELSQMQADNLQDIQGYQMERVGIQGLSEQFLRYMLLYRYGVFKPIWDKEIDDVGVIVRNPKRIRIPKFGASVDDLAYVLEDLEMSYGQILTQFGKKKADEVLKEQPKTAEFIDPKQINVNDNKVRNATYSITEVWTNDFVAWRIGSIILDKKPNPFYNSEDKSKNYFDKPKKPYIIKSLFTTEESLIGDTDYVQQMISIQDNINIRKRQIEDVSSKVANPMLLIDSDTMSEEQVSGITNEAGFILYGKDAADGNKIRFEQPGQLPNYVFLDLEGSRSAFDNIWGIHSTTRGEREGKETLGGRQLLKAADLGRIDLVARQLERALDELGGWWTQMMKMFYTEERSFSILGEDGRRFIQGFKGDQIGKNVKLRIVVGSTLPKDEITQRQEAIELWQNKAIGVKTLYQRLKMPNIDQAIEDYVATQSGAIFQQGQKGQPQQPMQQPMQPQV